MKLLIVPIAIIVGLNTIFNVDGKEINLDKNVQTIQSKRQEAHRMRVSVSGSETMFVTAVKFSGETTLVAEANATGEKTVETQLIVESISVPTVEENLTKEAKTADVKSVADTNRPTPVAASSVITQEETVKLNEEATRIRRIGDNPAETKKSNTLAETTDEVKTTPAAISDHAPEKTQKKNGETASYFKILKMKVTIIIQRLLHIIKKCFLILLLFFIIFVLEIPNISDAKNDIKNNCRNKKSFKEKFIQSTVPTILLFFNLMIFIPWSVFLGNASDFPFVFSDFFYKDLVCFFCLIFIFSFFVYFLSAKIRDVLTSVVSGLSLCFYFQYMFMNKYIGIMNGVEPEWNEHIFWGIINLIAWGIIFSFPFLLKKLYPFYSRIIIRLTTAILCLEIISVISLVCSAQKNVWYHAQQGFCDASNQFQLSKKKNILVFIFDALSVDFVKQCFETDPGLKDAMKDFTWYEDALSNYNLTFVALPHQMTGSMIHPSKNMTTMYKDLWQSVSARSFYTQIKNAGYDPRIYVKCKGIIEDYTLFEDYFSNIKNVETVYKVDYSKLCRCLVQMTGFSSVPYLFKRFFFYGDDFYINIVQQYVKSNLEESADSVVNTNDRLYNKLVSEGITTDADSPILSFHYTRGAHRPWRVDEKCQYHKKTFDTFLPPTKSCFYFISELIRLLKDNQLYDQTSIIISSDHGHFSIAGCSTDFWAMTFMVKPFFANNQEIVLDQSKLQSIDILPTILQLACEEKADFSCFEGFPLSEIPFDRQRIEYEGKHDENLDSFVGITGNNYYFNAFREFFVNLNDSRKKQYRGVIPLKAKEKQDDSF